MVRAYLACPDLDSLDELAARVTRVLGDEETASQAAADIATFIAAGEDELGISNLLLHPRLLPADRRASELLEALSGPETSYRTLMACVGISAIADDLDEDARAAAIGLLGRLCATGGSVTARRASASLFELLRTRDAPVVASLLGVADDVVRHNVIVAFLRISDPPRLADELRRLGDSHHELETLESLGPDPDPMDILLSPLGVPSLVRLPSFSEWSRSEAS